VSASKPITVIGGGLAGLTLGIGLRRKGIPVTIREAGHYPRHRVCGEFISGRGQEVLARLGLEEPLLQAGAGRAHSAVFYLRHARSPVRPLAQPALCISRFTLDALLARHFRQAGGQLLEEERWSESTFGEGIVRASGRRVQPPGHSSHWFGLKVHARQVPLAADLEMHGFQDGYVGVCRLANEEVNVCGLFRRNARTHASAASRQELLRGPPGTLLRERLKGAVFDESSLCSVAGLSLQPQRAAELGECCLGDAITMIPPVTGNGMSMAFESAALAIEPLAAWSQGEIPWSRAQQLVARACDRAFSRRLAWGKWLHRMMFLPGLSRFPGCLALRSACLWQLLFARTR